MDTLTLDDRLRQAIGTLEAISQAQANDDARDRLAHHQARNVAQLGRSSSLLLGPDHYVAFHILLRSVTESIFRLAWGVQSEANATSLELAAHNEFRKNAVSLIKKGHLSVHSESGEQLDNDVLELAAVSSDRAKPVRNMATELGLEAMYQLLYKPLSMQSHGSYSVVSPTPPQMPEESRTRALLGGVEITTAIAGMWLAKRQAISPAELQHLILHGSGPNNSFKPSPLRGPA